MTASQVDIEVEIRLKRQELLKRAEPPLLFFVLNEQVIRRIVGGKDVMHRQLQQLIEAADMPNITIEVVPFTAESCSRPAGAIRDSRVLGCR